ncbi:MAG: SDR family NAD(P)-dependent oxidoreductase, partial [Burkholderiaceae bacterium]|nr:SDR family NAD(P)-dependent oxidoreductase [Burkholderiaceae bacterium]
MPSNQMPLGALPARFRRPRVLIAGCGDVGLRAARALTPRVHVLALVRQAARAPALRALGIAPLRGDLDHAATLRRLAGLATHVIHLAPPPQTGEGDARTAALLRALARRRPPRSLVYGSTSGVYGDCAGAWIGETRSLNPQTARARRRAAAEAQV